METLELNEEQSDFLLEMMRKTDEQNATIGVSGPEVAQYNLRVLRLQSVGRHLKALEVEHSLHPVTQKIAAYHAQQGPAK
jgi:hypothetical protein